MPPQKESKMTRWKGALLRRESKAENTVADVEKVIHTRATSMDPIRTLSMQSYAFHEVEGSSRHENVPIRSFSRRVEDVSSD